ncbi:MAG: hypothetical protein KIT56_02725 [Gammaproteobacteria bacterium]|nr:hypothetical protein [Gammaproteobacteria bacterium]
MISNGDKLVSFQTKFLREKKEGDYFAMLQYKLNFDQSKEQAKEKIKILREKAAEV